MRLVSEEREEMAVQGKRFDIVLGKVPMGVGLPVMTVELK